MRPSSRAMPGKHSTGPTWERCGHKGVQNKRAALKRPHTPQHTLCTHIHLLHNEPQTHIASLPGCNSSASSTLNPVKSMRPSSCRSKRLRKANTPASSRVRPQPLRALRKLSADTNTCRSTDPGSPAPGEGDPSSGALPQHHNTKQRHTRACMPMGTSTPRLGACEKSFAHSLEDNAQHPLYPNTGPQASAGPPEQVAAPTPPTHYSPCPVSHPTHCPPARLSPPCAHTQPSTRTLVHTYPCTHNNNSLCTHTHLHTLAHTSPLGTPT
jgi:hypothetical protein